MFSVQDPASYLILPILVNVVLIVSNLLAAWGSIISCHILMIPWLALYFAYILFVFGLLLYMVVLLYHIWFKIVLFLIVSPILIICIIFWLTLLELFFTIKVTNSKKTKSRLPKRPHPVFSRPTKNVNFAPPHSHPTQALHPSQFAKHPAPQFITRQYRSNHKHRSNRKHKHQRKEGLHKTAEGQAAHEDSRQAEEYQKQNNEAVSHEDVVKPSTTKTVDLSPISQQVIMG